MNRNVESYFSTVPSIDIQRSSFDMSQDVKFTMNTGDFHVFYVQEVLPGDTFHVETSKVVRLQTLLTPVMDNIYLDTYFFMVPNRLVWNHWKEFCGENTQSAFLPEVTYTIPQIAPANMLDSTTYPEKGFGASTIFDDMGIPPDVNIAVNALPFRAAQLIYNEWFRSQDLQDPINIYKGDQTTYFYKGRSTSDTGSSPLYKVNKYHDYFTSASLRPLKGDPVVAPVSSSNNLGIPVGAVGSAQDTHNFGRSPLWFDTYGLDADNIGTHGSRVIRIAANQTLTTTNTAYLSNGTSSDTFYTTPMNLYGDVNALGINIMQLRNAFQVQRFLERDLYGTRYTELIRSHFGVQSPDSRLQRPEYLGGNRVPISIHQITNQSQGENDFLGDLGAMSLTTDRNEDFSYSSTEHGFIIGICCARTDRTYAQGVERFWLRKQKFDFYWPEFQRLSNQPIWNEEIYAVDDGVGSTNKEVFGYAEAWSDYRFRPNHVTGEMRPGVQNSLASWHFADYYTELPHLDENWLCEPVSNVDRTLAVTSELANQIFCDVYVRNIATRPMPVHSIPGLADHF